MTYLSGEDQRRLVNCFIAVSSNKGLISLLNSNGDDLDYDTTEYVKKLVEKNEVDIKDAFYNHEDEIKEYYKNEEGALFYLRSLLDDIYSW